MVDDFVENLARKHQAFTRGYFENHMDTSSDFYGLQRYMERKR